MDIILGNLSQPRSPQNVLRLGRDLRSKILETFRLRNYNTGFVVEGVLAKYPFRETSIAPETIFGGDGFLAGANC